MLAGRRHRSASVHARVSRFGIFVLMNLMGAASAHAGPQAARVDPASNNKPTKQVSEGENQKGVDVTQGEEPLSDAERISRLQRAIIENEKILAEQRAKLENPEDEYVKAESEFSKLDGEFQEKKKLLQKEKDAGAGDTSATEGELTALEPRWKLAKERFDLAIKGRKMLQEQISTLEQKIRQDQEALKKLVELKPAPTQESEAQATTPTTPIQTGKPVAGGTAPSVTPIPGAAPTTLTPGETAAPAPQGTAAVGSMPSGAARSGTPA